MEEFAKKSLFRKRHNELKKNRNRQLDKLQAVLGIRFRDRSLLGKALVHRSYLNEHHPDISDNERLEYLGDSVLGLVVNEYLFSHYENYREGELAKIKSVVVSEEVLSMVASEIDLGSYLLMGKGEEATGGRERKSILADTVEAIIGACYLDSGLKYARKFILHMLRNHIDRIDHMTYQRDPKTALQEYVQKKYKDRPVYKVLEETGPDHSKEFVVGLIVNGKQLVTGSGCSKRKAEMEAAGSALEKIESGEISL